jgi:sugar lactone lactonase YvrE
MKGRTPALAAGLLAGVAMAEPAVVASGAYPEGLLWHGGRMYFTEMGADRVSIIADGGARQFWSDPGCGPTDIAPFGPTGFLVNCHLGKMMVEVSASGATGRRFRAAPDGTAFQDPNASTGDSEGGVYFSDSGVFSLLAPSTGRVFHISAMGVMTEVLGQVHYANGVGFDPASRTLYVSEHLSRRVLALTLDRRQRVTAKSVFVDFAQHEETSTHTYELAGPDGIALRGGYVAVAEYGEGRVHLFDGRGRVLKTMKVSMPFVDTVAWDEAGNLYAGGSFQNTSPPFEGAVVRFAPAEWQAVPEPMAGPAPGAH